MIYIIVGLIIVLVIALILFLKYYKLNFIIKKIDVCEDNIYDILDYKEKLLVSLLKKINDDKISKKSVFKESNSVFEIENSLFDIRWNLNKYLENKKDLEKYKKELRKLNVNEDNLDGLKDFYNITVLNYNELLLKKPFYYFYKLLKFEQKKTFKARKLEQYEIFKN